MRITKKAAIAIAAAISLPFTFATPAHATNITTCGDRTDVAKFEHPGGPTCFTNTGTIAYDIYNAWKFTSGNNRVIIAYVDSDGRLRSKEYPKNVVVVPQTRRDGTPLGPIFDRVYQIWIL